MGQYYSTFFDDAENMQNFRQTETGVRYEVLLANPTKLMPLKLSKCKYQTTRFLWHFQSVAKRREDFLSKRVAALHEHNVDHSGIVRTRKAFRELGKIDLNIFKERKQPRKARNNRLNDPRIKYSDTRRVTRSYDKKGTVENKRRRNNRNQRYYSNFDYSGYAY